MRFNQLAKLGFVFFVMSFSSCIEIPDCDDLMGYPNPPQVDIEYKVKVVNQDGKAVPGIVVATKFYYKGCVNRLIAQEEMTTDDNGLVSGSLSYEYTHSDDGGQWNISIVNDNIEILREIKTYSQSVTSLSSTVTFIGLED